MTYTMDRWSPALQQINSSNNNNNNSSITDMNYTLENQKVSPPPSPQRIVQRRSVLRDIKPCPPSRRGSLEEDEFSNSCPFKNSETLALKGEKNDLPEANDGKNSAARLRIRQLQQQLTDRWCEKQNEVRRTTSTAPVSENEDDSNDDNQNHAEDHQHQHEHQQQHQQEQQEQEESITALLDRLESGWSSEEEDELAPLGEEPEDGKQPYWLSGDRSYKVPLGSPTQHKSSILKKTSFHHSWSHPLWDVSEDLVAAAAAPGRRAGGVSSPPRSVSFDQIEIREYERTRGDNHPGCRAGPSIGLGWGYVKSYQYSLEDYERTRPARRTTRELYLPASKRNVMLVEQEIWQRRGRRSRNNNNNDLLESLHYTHHERQTQRAQKAVLLNDLLLSRKVAGASFDKRRGNKSGNKAASSAGDDPRGGAVDASSQLSLQQAIKHQTAVILRTASRATTTEAGPLFLEQHQHGESSLPSSVHNSTTVYNNTTT